MKYIILLTFFLFSSLSIYCQILEPKDTKHTEDWTRKPPIISGKAMKWETPTDALVLLDNNTDQWSKLDGSKVEWILDNGVLTVKPGSDDIMTKSSFGDCHLHIEWRSPTVVKGEGQGRGNSGIFMQSRYEIQILEL